MITIENEQAMLQFGEKIGTTLRGGEVIELIGDVGAGKTTFVRGLAKGLLISETIQSPSFTISRVYNAKDELLLAHYDFYRLNEPGIMMDELNEAMSDNKTIVVVEWADTVKDILPNDRLTIRIESLSESSRSVAAIVNGKAYTHIEEIL